MNINFLRKAGLFILLLHVIFTGSFAQDSSHMRISLLTCTPGEELYSTFGHSAIRVVDSNSVTDYVYNYGTFNFDDDGFYMKFMRGKLLYYISVERFNDFKFDYQAMNRGITEQVLNLTAVEKINILHFLHENLKEENKYYKYDFFLDNCTTRLRDIIVKSKTPHPELPAVMPGNTTFRNAIHQYLDKGKQYWSKLGIDILLGSPTDAVMTTNQQQFLPDNLMTSIDSVKNTKLVLQRNHIFDSLPVEDAFIWFTPTVFFSLLLFFFIALHLSKNKVVQITASGLDGFLFFMTGLIGILLIFMMTATDHSMTKSNYNILWAWPTHIIAAFFINSKKKIFKLYFLICSITMGLLLLSWYFLPQQMSLSLLPFVTLLLFMSVNQYQKS